MNSKNDNYEQNIEVVETKKLINTLLSKTNLKLLNCRIINIKDNENPDIISEQRLELKISLKADKRFCFCLTLTGEDVLDIRSFIKKLAKITTNIQFPLKNKEFQKLISSIHDVSKHKNVYINPGHNKNVYVTKNKIINYTGINVYDYETSLDKTNYDLPENSYILNDNKCQPELDTVITFEFPVFRAFFLNLAVSYKNPASIVCFGGILASCFWDIFIRIAEGFPAIFIFGQPHSGKTTLLKTAASIFGIHKISKEASGNSTSKTLYRNLGSRNNIPLFIEEFPKEIFLKLEPVIKNVFNALTRYICTQDDVKPFPVKTTIATTSNDFFPEIKEQVISRLLFVNLKKGDFIPEYFNYFTEESRTKLSQILPVLLNHRKDIPNHFTYVHNRIQTLLSKYNDRCISNIAVSLTMWHLINNIVGEEIVNIDKIAVDYYEMYKNYLDIDISAADRIMFDIEKLLNNNILVYGEDYILVKKHFLRLNLNKYITKYNLENPSRIIKASHFRLLVENDPRFDTKTVPTKEIGRAILIDISSEETLLTEVTKTYNLYENIRKVANNE